MNEEGDWLRMRSETGMAQDVLRRSGEIREDWYARALSLFERFVSRPNSLSAA